MFGRKHLEYLTKAGLGALAVIAGLDIGYQSHSIPEYRIPLAVIGSALFFAGLGIWSYLILYKTTELVEPSNKM